jgi:NAD dependent epimerase/dehydratase family.
VGKRMNVFKPWLSALSVAKFLVLGLGFIATHVAEGLSKIGQVTVTYRSLSGVKGVYADLLRGMVELVRVNPTVDRDLLASLVKNSDTVINLIGVLSGSETTLREAHVTVPELLASLIAKQSPSTMLIHVSASNVMGPVGSFITEEPRHCEGARPSNLYEETKCLGERVVYSTWLSSGFPMAIVRPTLVYGRYAAHSQFMQMFNVARLGVVPMLKVRVMTISAVKLTELFARLHADRPRGLYMYATECEPVPISRFIEDMAKALSRRIIKVPVPNQLLKLALPSDIKPLYRYVGVTYDCGRMRSMVSGLRFMDEEVYENALFIKRLREMHIHGD